jgi:hypothetical protein
MAVHTDEPWDEVKQRYITQSYAQEFERCYRNDRIYDMGKDDLARKMGVFIIHTTNPDLQSAMQKLPLHLTGTESDPKYETLQGQNLNNVDVAQSLHPYGMTDTMGVPVDSPQNYTGIKHYTRLKLSNILLFFDRFGIHHVNIVEECCRVFMSSPPPVVLQRQISHKEKQGYIHMKKTIKRCSERGRKKTIHKTKTYT